MVKVLYLISAAGSPNFGDELITLGWLKRLRRDRPDVSIIVDCHNPVFFTLLLRRYSWADGITVTDLCWRSARRAATHGVYDGMKAQRPLLYSDYSNAYDDIKWGISSLGGEIDTVHLLGGGYLFDRWPANLLLFMVAEWLAKTTSAHLVATGAGVFVSNFPLLFDVAPSLRSFDYISVRDPASQKILQDVGISSKLEPDDVVLCLPPKITNQGNNGLALNVQLDQFSSDEYARLCSSLSAQVADETRDVYVLDLYPNVDTAFSKYILSVSERVKLIRLEEVLDSVLEGNWAAPFWGGGISAIGTRYHFHYVWSWLGSEGSFISADRYYSIKHSEVLELGSNWKAYPERGAVPNIDRTSVTDQKNLEFRMLYGSG